MPKRVQDQIRAVEEAKVKDLHRRHLINAANARGNLVAAIEAIGQALERLRDCPAADHIHAQTLKAQGELIKAREILTGHMARIP